MSEPLRIFIGFDPRQPVAFQVCAHSIWEHASKPVSITRLDLRTLPIKRRGLTSFTYSRFLVPYLSNFEGYSLFLDSDILMRHDPYRFEIVASQHPAIDFMYVEDRTRLFERPSMMFFKNSSFTHLTPEFVEREKMFDFAWLEGKGAWKLDKDWNHLVGYDAPNPDAKVVHYTMGVPVWEETKNCEFAKEWWETFQRMNSTVSFNELMGRSVHVLHLEKLKANA